MSHQGVVDLCVMVYDKLCHNNQDENEQGLATFEQVSLGVNIWRKVFKYSNILFSLYNFFKR